MHDQKPDYEVDYAYIKQSTSEFGCAHISLHIGNDKLVLTVRVPEEISKPDLQPLLMGLQNNQFRKMRLNIVNDCDVCLITPNGYSEVTMIMENESVVIQNITFVER